MGFPKKISQLPLNLSLKPGDLFITVNDNDVTSKIELTQLVSFVTGGTNSFVTGGTYNNITKNIDFIGTSMFPPFSVNLSGISTSDTFVTGATLNGFTLEIDRNNGEPQITVDLSPLTGGTDTNTFVTGTTLVATNYTINQNNGSSFTTDFNPIISGKVDTTLFDAYTADTQTEINSKLDITTFDTYTAGTVDNNTFVTGGTLTGTNLILEKNNDVDASPIDLSALSGSTFSWSNPIVKAGNTSGDCITNLWVSSISGCSPLHIGTEMVVNNKVTLNGDLDMCSGGTLFVSTISGCSPITISAIDNVNIESSNADIDVNASRDLILESGRSVRIPTLDTGKTPNSGDIMASKDVKGNLEWVTPYKFTGNTSVDCIDELWVSSISGCSPLTIGTELVVNEDTSISGHLTVTSSGTSTSDTVFLVQDSLGNHIIDCNDDGHVHIGDLVNSAIPTDPTLLIGAGKTPNDRGSLAFTSSGIGIGGDNDGTRDILLFRVHENIDSQWRFYNQSSFGWILNDRQSNAFGSQSGTRSTISTARSYGMDFMLDINDFGVGVADPCGFRFSSKDSTIAGSNDVERFVIENGSLKTKSYFDNISVLGVGTSNPNTGSTLHVSGDTLINGGLTADTFTISDTPTVNNSGTEILVRNSTSGEVEYREVSTLTGSTDTNTFITGTTLVGDSYTLKRNDGVDIITDFNPIVSGKVNTSLFDVYTADTQTEINSKLDITTFDSYTANTTDDVVTGATLVGTTLELERNNGLSDVTVDLSSLSGDTNTFITGATLTNTTLDIERNDGVDISVDLSSIDNNVFVVSGNANVATQQLTFTNTTGGTFNVTNAASLYSDNDINVTGGTYNTNTGCVSFVTNSGTTFDVCGFVTGLTDTFISGTTLVGTDYSLNRSDGVDFITDFNPIVSGKVDTTTFNTYTADTQTDIDTKLDITTFDTYTANTTDDVVTGATLVGTTLELERNNGLSDVTVDLSSLTGDTDTNTFVSGGTLENGTLTLGRNDGIDVTITGFSSGNTIYTTTTNFTATVAQTITHNLDSTNIIVQTIDTNTSELINGTISNYTNNSVDVTLSSSINNIKTVIIGNSNNTTLSQSFNWNDPVVQSGNTSGTCIDQLFIHSISGCSPVLMGDTEFTNEVTFNEDIIVNLPTYILTDCNSSINTITTTQNFQEYIGKTITLASEGSTRWSVELQPKYEVTSVSGCCFLNWDIRNCVTGERLDVINYKWMGELYTGGTISIKDTEGCFVVSGTCDEETQEFLNVNTLYEDCESCTAITYTLISCWDGNDPIYTNTDLSTVVGIGSIKETNSGICYEVFECEVECEPITVVEFESYLEGCESGICPPNWQLTSCSGEILGITTTDMSIYPGIIFTATNTTHCFSVEGVQMAATEGFETLEGLEELPPESCDEYPCINFTIYNCEGEEIGVTNQDLSVVAGGTYSGSSISILSGICFTIESGGEEITFEDIIDTEELVEKDCAECAPPETLYTIFNCEGGEIGVTNQDLSLVEGGTYSGASISILSGICFTIESGGEEVSIEDIIDTEELVEKDCAECTSEEGTTLTLDGVSQTTNTDFTEAPYDAASPGEDWSWILITYSEVGPIAQDVNTVFTADDFFTGSFPDGLIVINESLGVYLPQAGFNGIGDFVPGESYQVNINTNSIINSGAAGLEGFFTF